MCVYIYIYICYEFDFKNRGHFLLKKTGWLGRAGCGVVVGFGEIGFGYGFFFSLGHVKLNMD